MIHARLNESNVCFTFQLPNAQDISDEELLRLVESDDPSGYRVPMSLGEPHAEIDKSILVY